MRNPEVEGRPSCFCALDVFVHGPLTYRCIGPVAAPPPQVSPCRCSETPARCACSARTTGPTPRQLPRSAAAGGGPKTTEVGSAASLWVPGRPPRAGLSLPPLHSASLLPGSSDGRGVTSGSIPGAESTARTDRAPSSHMRVRSTPCNKSLFLDHM